MRPLCVRCASGVRKMIFVVRCIPVFVCSTESSTRHLAELSDVSDLSGFEADISTAQTELYKNSQTICWFPASLTLGLLVLNRCSDKTSDMNKTQKQLVGLHETKTQIIADCGFSNVLVMNGTQLFLGHYF